MIPISVTKQKILKEIREHPIHGYKIGKKLNLQTSTIYEHLNELESEGFIKSKKENDKIIYTLTERGKLLVKALFDKNK